MLFAAVFRVHLTGLLLVFPLFCLFRLILHLIGLFVAGFLLIH